MDWLRKRVSKLFTIPLNQLHTRIRNSIASTAKRRTEERKTSVRSQVAGIEAGNLCIAVSTTGLMALGAIPMSLPILIGLAMLFLVLGIIGRYVDAVEDDVERLLKYEEHIREGANSSNTDSVSSDSIQQQSD